MSDLVSDGKAVAPSGVVQRGIGWLGPGWLCGDRVTPTKTQQTFYIMSDSYITSQINTICLTSSTFPTII